MPRRSTLSAAEREQLLALPDTSEEFIRHYTFSEADLSLIHQHRGAANRLGLALVKSLVQKLIGSLANKHFTGQAGDGFAVASLCSA